MTTDAALDLAPLPAQEETPPAAPRPDAAPLSAGALDLLADVELEVTVELGRRRLSLGELARLRVGSVVELETLVGDPVSVYANGRLVATGEAVVVDDQFGVRIDALATAGRAG